ncbi:MAG: enoyl-CoA hydratase/isomerase family protein [Burkholderiales bacterium]|nr:enoyl-CoA hydratase/isomerase family protein [Burkholderiales bacterium]
MSYQTIETALNEGVALIWLNRPELRNALNETLIAELTDAFESAIDDDSVRAILLAGHGKAFCAGADLNWMKRARDFTPEQNRADTAALARLLRTIYESPKPTVARVHGPAFAGGMGLVTACDIALASTDAKFCLSEVKLGLIPAMISPYVIKAMGESTARRYFLTAEVIEAAEAYRIGLIHDLSMPVELDDKVNEVLGHLVQGGPQALRETKRLIRDVSGRAIDDALLADTAERIARVRAGDEGQEGIASFFEKRKPAWVPDQS